MSQKSVEWRINCRTTAQKIYDTLITPEGRMSFWAESANQLDDHIHFEFPNGLSHSSRVIESIPNKLFCLEYFEAKTTFMIHPNDDNTCTLTLHAENIPEPDFMEVHAGWVSVLLNLKAFLEHGIDLRNHNQNRTWDQGFVDN